MVEKLLHKADLHFKNKNYSAAEILYSEIIENYWKSCDENSHKKAVSKALNNRGQIKYLRVDFDEAIEDYTKALELNNITEVLLYNRGLIHYRLGRYDQAIADFNNSLKIKPDFKDSIDALKIAEKEQNVK